MAPLPLPSFDLGKDTLKARGPSCRGEPEKAEMCGGRRAGSPRCVTCVWKRVINGNRHSSASLAREESGMSKAKGRPLPLLRKSEKALRRREVPDVPRKVLPCRLRGRLCCVVGTHGDVSCSLGVWRAPFEYFISTVLSCSHCKSSLGSLYVVY